MFKTRIITLFILIVSLTVIAVAATTAAAQDRVKIHKVAEVDTTGSVSSDGRSLTYTDWTTGNLAVRDLATGEKHHLTSKGWPEFAFPSTISPDGQQVAYGWTNQDGSCDLRIINLDGSEPRVVYHDQKAMSVQHGTGHRTANTLWLPSGKKKERARLYWSLWRMVPYEC